VVRRLAQEFPCCFGEQREEHNILRRFRSISYRAFGIAPKPGRVVHSCMSPKTVLIADDSAAMRLSVRFLLQGRHSGLKVREAVDGVDAIEKAKKSKPDLILLDLAMPRLNGAEAAAVLRNTMPETPVVLFTLNTDLYADAVCAALGVEFISKVDGLPKLLERVDALLPPAIPPNPNDEATLC